MKVLKFGGTSVGTPESLANVRSIVESQPEPCIVVVSALGGLTDRLIATAEMAAKGDSTYLQEFDGICARHRKVAESVIPSGFLGDAWDAIKVLLDELGTIFKAISLLGELTERSRNLVVSYGERMSHIIVTAMIKDAQPAQSLDFIRTKKVFEKSVLDAEKSSELIAKNFERLKDAKTVVVPGFIARDEDNRISNLGRGGSDYTAAILAAELGADVLEIWTDVDGFMSADPRVVKEAHVIDRLSFVEAMELCNFGAKVVYPPTIYPVFHKNIPIVIKNTFNPTAKGTRISDKSREADDTESTLGVTAIADTRLLTLENGSGKMYERMINALTRNGIETLMPDGKRSCGVRNADATRAETILREEFASELVDGTLKSVNISQKLSTPALVGRRDNSEPSEIAAALNVEGIPVIHGPQRASGGTIACMVPRENLNDALRVIHMNFIHNKQNNNG